ncbi:Ankyrin repeat-containing protein [Lentzea albidocapillata subsp. violacea]|uniref:Ankyrin repeat-containing protein n=1 Tax=Lentzea albidocapillata subsp. violacea TaxID=128104 RepID=A0A1H0AFC7_9PSEU|nr:ankyrin repeat domain-containing protein [Lentzea albidocapillata]SDN32115.1 Ankyrin repeat-containing protein [Lentzea albidocapillata subsp. violacea]
MTTPSADDSLATALTTAIHTGDTDGLRQHLRDRPALATARINGRSPLHIATDWPGHFPNVANTIAVLVDAGAEVNARFQGSHSETPLHWAASSDDVEALDALLDAGADIDADGAVIAGGTPLADARAFAQWRTARRLVERGATTTLTDAATLGLLDRVKAYFPGATSEEVNVAFWGACHGGQQECAEYLLGHGAELNWTPPWEPMTPLDAAERSKATDLVLWLRERGAKSAVK